MTYMKSWLVPKLCNDTIKVFKDGFSSVTGVTVAVTDFDWLVLSRGGVREIHC